MSICNLSSMSYENYSFLFRLFSTNNFVKVEIKRQPTAYPHDWPRSDLYPEVSRKYLAIEICHCVVPLNSCIVAPQHTAPLFPFSLTFTHFLNNLGQRGAN